MLEAETMRRALQVMVIDRVSALTGINKMRLSRFKSGDAGAISLDEGRALSDFIRGLSKEAVQ